ncbi:MAG: M3 family oligoendopeptidase [Pseudomonadota bacterium]|nr:M3 family oligoendopeptidase [Pseudomonadota bacterium]
MEVLPEWDLSDLYNGMEDPAIKRDLEEADTCAQAFVTKYQGKLARLGGKALGNAVVALEEIDELLNRTRCYGQLLFAANTQDPDVAAFYQNLNDRTMDIASNLIFFGLELNHIEDELLARKLKDKGLRRYKPWIDVNRMLKPYQLGNDLEKFMHDKRVTGRDAFIRLFDETMAWLTFDVDGRALSSSEVLDMMMDPKGSVRRKAAKAFGAGLGDNLRIFSLITNSLAKDKEIEDRWRGYQKPISQRNLANQVEDGVVEALITSVKAAYPAISHRYYALKARWLEMEVMDYWDRNAPLPDAGNDRISWADACATVLGAYQGFAPQMRQIAERFFESGWIDAQPRPGKDSGAFSHSTVPSVHPYILMNYHGRARDVMTLAHELGHGVHQVLAAPHGHFLSDTPLTLAETASVFGEMLTFRNMLDAATNAATRRSMLARKVEDMLNTVVRQVAFCDFELRVHYARRAGEVGVERLGEIWLDVQRESLGPAFRFDEEYKFFWAYIPHFIHAPFYVYAYAFGDCLVNSLYDVFQSGFEGFHGKYLEMLKAGGTLRHKELLTPFGLDAEDPEFWERGLSVIAGFVDELEVGTKIG